MVRGTRSSGHTSKNSEKVIQNSILEYLTNYVQDGYFWQNDSVGIYDPVKKTFRRKPRYAINGISDILGIYKGKFIAIEVKRPETKNNASKDQKTFLKNINSLGGHGIVATCIEDVQILLKTIAQDVEGQGELHGREQVINQMLIRRAIRD